MTDLDSSPRLDIRQISKRFGPVWAIRDLSLQVMAGQMVGLLGPNGAGKSTLIRLCAGWLHADGGEIWIGSDRQGVSARNARRQLGVVSADAPVYDELTVEETLYFMCALYGLARPLAHATVKSVMSDLRMQDFHRQRVGRLSVGMRQRVRLACAILHEPALLLLDEPTANLDLEVRQLIWEQLRRLQSRGTAILMCTHNLQEAAGLCTSIHLLAKGVLGPALLPGPDGFAAPGLEQHYLSALGGAPEGGAA